MFRFAFRPTTQTVGFPGSTNRYPSQTRNLFSGQALVATLRRGAFFFARVDVAFLRIVFFFAGFLAATFFLLGVFFATFFFATFFFATFFFATFFVLFLLFLLFLRSS